MNKILLTAIFFISTNCISAVTTQYPGCSPNDSSAAELNTKPERYYPVQPQLNRQAMDAIEAIRKQKQ